jgi:hypothetical protein
MQGAVATMTPHHHHGGGALFVLERVMPVPIERFIDNQKLVERVRREDGDRLREANDISYSAFFDELSGPFDRDADNEPIIDIEKIAARVFHALWVLQAELESGGRRS